MRNGSMSNGCAAPSGPVTFWAGVYVKAGLEKDKAAMLVILAGLRDGRKIILAVESGYRESTESWAALLRDLNARGLRPPRLVVGDGHLGNLERWPPCSRRPRRSAAGITGS